MAGRFAAWTSATTKKPSGDAGSASTAYTILTSILGEREYNLESVGFKYHLNDLAAAVGLGNLPDLPRNLARHRQIAATYKAGLKNVPGLTLLSYPYDRESSWWVFTVLVERREDFIRALKDKEGPSVRSTSTD